MALHPFNDEQLNYFKFATIALNEFPKALRQTFRSMWDNSFGHRPGYQPWDDSAVVKNLFLVEEGGTTRVPVHLSLDEWDCTALFQATLYAHSFSLPASGGHYKTLGELYVKPRKLARGTFHASVFSLRGDGAETLALAIDQLRLLRNSLCHLHSSEISKVTFDWYIQLSKDAFAALGVISGQLDVIGSLSESDFPIQRVQELQESINEENRAYSRFLENTMSSGIENIQEEAAATRKDIAVLRQEINAAMHVVINIESITRARTGRNQPYRRLQLPDGTPGSSTTHIDQGRRPAQRKEYSFGCPAELQLNALDHSTEIQIWDVILSFKKAFGVFLQYLTNKLNVLVRSHDRGSLIITVECSSLQILEGFWEYYRSGLLNNVAQVMLVRPEVLAKLDCTEIKLNTFISEEEYEEGKQIFKNSSLFQSKPHTSDVMRKWPRGEGSGKADTYHLLGCKQYISEDFISALRSHQRAFAIRRKLYGEEHSDTADSYQLVGCTQNELGDFTSALQSAKRALDIKRKLFGEKHPDTADCYHLLGWTQHELQDFASALQSAQRALGIRREYFGEVQTSTACSYHLLGWTHHELNDFGSALQYALRGLGIRLKIFGEEDTWTADSHHLLGWTLYELGNFDSAMQCAWRALHIRRRLLGEEHPDTADSQRLIGLTRSALYIRRKLLGEEHPGTADSQRLIGFTRSAPYARVRRRLLGEEHPDKAESQKLFELTRSVSDELIFASIHPEET